jgi:hypothetical protein
MYTEFKLHSMVETIDLTLSDDEGDISTNTARTQMPCYSTLPFQHQRSMEKPARKRLRSNSPTLRVHSRRQRESAIYTQQWRPPYFHGAVRHVHVAGHPRRDDIELSEVLEVGTLDEAVLSSFSWDIDWLFGDIGLGRVDTTFIADERNRRSCARQIERTPCEISATHLWHYPPRRGQQAGVHGKLMLLFRKDGIMRVVIPTGNLRRADWGAVLTQDPLINGVSHSLHNLVFMLDLPERQQGDSGISLHNFHFQRELVNYLDAMNVPSRIQERVTRYDFSECARFRFFWTG